MLRSFLRARLSLATYSTRCELLDKQAVQRLGKFSGVRFKSQKAEDRSQVPDDLKIDVDEITKQLDANLKKKPEESELELDKKFMSFQRLREVCSHF